MGMISAICTKESNKRDSETLVEWFRIGQFVFPTEEGPPLNLGDKPMSHPQLVHYYYYTWMGS